MDLELSIRLWFYIYFVFILHLWSQCPHHLEAILSISNSNQLIGLSMILTLWSRCIVFSLLYVLFILFICFMLSLLLSIGIFNFIVCCCWFCFFYYSFFNLFYCRCSGSSMYFTFFCRLPELCCLCCQCLLEPYYSFAVITLYLFLFLFSLLTHCVSYSGYCHCYLYDLALVLLVWLLILLVYYFSYGDFIVNENVISKALAKKFANF